MSEMLKNLKVLLDTSILDASKVFIVGHNEPDFDAIGSAIGLQTLCQHLKKESYIIMNDQDVDLEPGVKKIKDDNKEIHNIIDLDEYQNLKDTNSLLIMTDVNKDYLISVKNNLNDFKSILIIDHHSEDENTVDAQYKYIDTKASSACEIVSQILNSTRCKYDAKIANLLLSGIVLDTKRYMKNTSSQTHKVVEQLMKKGADADWVNELFLVEFDVDRKINDLVFNGTIFQNDEHSLFATSNISFTLNRTKPSTIYRKEEIAKAADKMLKYPVAAAFVLGYVKDGIISISARSKSDIDVGSIMGRMNGGGNPKNAGGRVESDNILKIEQRLMEEVQLEISSLPETEETLIMQKVKK